MIRRTCRCLAASLASLPVMVTAIAIIVWTVRAAVSGLAVWRRFVQTCILIALREKC